MNSMKKQNLEPYLTIQDVCGYLKITNESLYAWIKNTDIPAHRVGKRWLFDKNELDAWVKSGRAADSKEKDKTGIAD